MRQECKHFESRTYANGETVRKCDLDLAPDAPWRCPDNCPKYERRLAAVAWTHGTLIAPPTPDEPASVADGTAAALLDEAENHLLRRRPGARRGRGRAAGRAGTGAAGAAWFGRAADAPEFPLRG